MLFDKEFEFTGKHATYCRALRDEIKVIETYREIYTYSAIIGFIYGRKSVKDTTEKVAAASILPSELSKKRMDLKNIYRFIMLLEETPGFSIEDYKRRTFKDDADEDSSDKVKENMEIFNSYARGGIEYLYEKFKDCTSKQEVVDELNVFLNEFNSSYVGEIDLDNL